MELGAPLRPAPIRPDRAFLPGEKVIPIRVCSDHVGLAERPRVRELERESLAPADAVFLKELEEAAGVDHVATAAELGPRDAVLAQDLHLDLVGFATVRHFGAEVEILDHPPQGVCGDLPLLRLARRQGHLRVKHVHVRSEAHQIALSLQRKACVDRAPFAAATVPTALLRVAKRIGADLLHDALIDERAELGPSEDEHFVPIIKHTLSDLANPWQISTHDVFPFYPTQSTSATCRQPGPSQSGDSRLLPLLA